MTKGAIALTVVMIFAGGCGKSERKFTSLSGQGSIQKINRSYEKDHQAERKKRESREKNAQSHSRTPRPDDASQFPDTRTEPAD